MASSRNSSRVALVTGAGDPDGMGAAIARRLAENGHCVGVLDILGDGAHAVAEQITQAGGKALALEADVADRTQVEHAVVRLRDAFGPIGILINNAAIEGWSPFSQLTDDVWDRTFGVNVKGTFIVTQTVLPDMEAGRWGRIVNVSALGGQMGGAYDMSHYNASKGALITFTKSLAIGLGAKGITVNTVSPGFIDTPMARRAIDAGLFPVPPQTIIDSYPIPRLGSAEDVATAVCFFTSEDAGYITNQTLGVNGGCYD